MELFICRLSRRPVGECFLVMFHAIITTATDVCVRCTITLFSCTIQIFGCGDITPQSHIIGCGDTIGNAKNDCKMQFSSNATQILLLTSLYLGIPGRRRTNASSFSPNIPTDTAAVTDTGDKNVNVTPLTTDPSS